MVSSIDLGSNTLRICVMDENKNIVSSSEAIVGSARNLKKDGKLDNEAKKRIMSALEKFTHKYDLCKSKAVATEAFRMASDSDEFFREIYAKFGIKFEIISGESEAKLTALAIKNRLEKLQIYDKNALFIDLGGGSSEISFGDNFKSFKFGIVTFFNEFNSLEKMQENADCVVKNATKFIQKFNFDKVVLTSGVPTTLAALKLKMDYQSYDANLVNGTKLSYEEIKNAINEISILDVNLATKLLGKDRQILMIAGCILLTNMLKNFKDREFIVIDDGLREGVCLYQLAKR